MAYSAYLKRHIATNGHGPRTSLEDNRVIRMLIVGTGADADDGLREYLGSEGYLVDVVEAPAQLDGDAYESSHLVFLEGDAPGVDATGICRRVRKSNEKVPLIVLSKKASEVDKARALLAGADDYIVRPFGYLELAARVKAILRRTAAPPVDAYRFGSIEVDFSRAEVRRQGQTVDMTALEFKLLETFVRRRGRLLSRQQLLDAAWEHEVEGELDSPADPEDGRPPMSPIAGSTPDGRLEASGDAAPGGTSPVVSVVPAAGPGSASVRAALAASS